MTSTAIAYTHDYIRGLAAGVEPWDAITMTRESNIARALMNRHDHGWSASDFHSPEDRALTLENCGACTLKRLHRQTGLDDGAPNYSGWLRVYIQNRVSVPARWLQSEMAYAARENTRYFNAILRDVKTFGLLKYTKED